MDTYLWITSVIGVYLGIAVFVVGMGWRVYQWATTPKSPVRLGMFPKPATKGGRFVKMLKDTFIAPHSAKIEPVMWVFAFAFHIAALGALSPRTGIVDANGPGVAAVDSARTAANSIRVIPDARPGPTHSSPAQQPGDRQADRTAADDHDILAGQRVRQPDCVHRDSKKVKGGDLLISQAV